MSSEIHETAAVVFGHRIVDLPGNIEDLITLEKEGAIYSHFWDEGSKTFRYYRIPFLPGEIYQYVKAHVARQEFADALEQGAEFEEALASISNPEIARGFVHMETMDTQSFGTAVNWISEDVPQAFILRRWKIWCVGVGQIDTNRCQIWVRWINPPS